MTIEQRVQNLREEFDRSFSIPREERRESFEDFIAVRVAGERLGIAFALESHAPAVRVNADLDRLIQVLSNLLSNAAKYSPPQGVVTVSVARRGGMVRVSVTDLGAGIPEEFQKRIFQKFSQADSSDTRQKGGSGLGLNISKAIVEKHGGTIGFVTQKGIGTTFYFELPELPPGRSGGSGSFPRMPST